MNVMASLAEDEYFYGVAALLNSTVHFGDYFDRVIIGYRGALPKWLPKLTTTERGYSLRTTADLIVEFVELQGSMHMVHEKPRWMVHLMETLAPGADTYYFFDSDIVINAELSFFRDWVKRGVAVCGDVNFLFPRTHPIRKTWTAYADEAGRSTLRQLDNYFNSGFLGWRQQDAVFIKDWLAAFEILLPYSGDTKQFRVNGRTHPVMSANQDSLNLALMLTEAPVSLLGPEAMGFTYGMRLMYHPIGAKPWNRDNFLDFLKGQPPRDADVAFWRFANGDAFKPYSKILTRYKLYLCLFLRLMGRFYRA